MDATERLAHWRRWHAYVLDRKGCWTDDDVLDAIAFDRVVAMAGARDLCARRPDDLLDHFFEGHAAHRAEVGAVVDEDIVNHLGFQIREPLDMWLEGLTRWAPRLDVAVVGTKRFTSSATFQARVGAFAEMAQIWLDMGEQVVELELFDIHHVSQPDPRLFDRVRAGRDTRQLIAECGTDELVALIDDDDIWHYGIRVASGDDVTRLHKRFQVLTAADPNYRLRSDDVVSNRWHGSMHTKLANRDAGVEIEFLSYNVDWADSTD
jgi:hypothetical protein